MEILSRRKLIKGLAGGLFAVPFTACIDRTAAPITKTVEPEPTVRPDPWEKAKQVLGCDSAQACKDFCDNPANVQKCADFANQVDLRGRK